MSSSALYLGQKFSSYDEFEEARRKYEKEQMVPYPTLTSKSAHKFNEQQAMEGKPLMPVEFRWKEGTIACKHYGKTRFHEHVEGKKERPNQQTFKNGCPAKVNVNYSMIDKCLVVTKVVEDHNHARSNIHSDLYPEFRRPSEDTVENVFQMFNDEAKPHRIRDKIFSTGVYVNHQDLQNLRGRWKNSIKGGVDVSPEQAVFDQLSKLLEEDPGGSVALKYDENTSAIQSIFFQTSFMKESFKSYPEVLIMDTTYRLCTNDMPLIVFDVVDSFGAGRVAGYAIISSEKLEIVSEALQILCLGCEEASSKITTVMIDKDQSEIAAVKEILPQAEVHLCDFHVKDAIERSGKKYQRENWDTVFAVIKKMIHAHSLEDYKKAYCELETVANSDLMGYINKHWHSTQLVWSDYQRNMCLNFGERTTGRVESHNAKIKKLIAKRLSVAEVIMQLRVSNRNARLDSEYKLFVATSKTSYHKYSTDPIIQEIQRNNTPFVADLLLKQYKRSLEPPTHNQHQVSNVKCDCKFFTNFQMPCAHIFRDRRVNGIKIYDHEMVPARWTVVIPFNEKENTVNPDGIVVVDRESVKIPKRPKLLSEADSYTKALSICHRICSLICVTGGKQYQGRLNALLSMETLFRMGKEVLVCGLDESNRANTVVISDFVENGESNNNSPNQVAISGATEDVECQVSKTSSLSANIGDTNVGGGSKKAEATSAKQSNEPKSVSVTVSSKSGFKALSAEVQATLRLPVAITGKGRPKNKKTTKRIRNAKKSVKGEGSDTEVIDDEGLDPQQVLCTSCKGPSVLRTSFSKANNGRKYYTCSNPQTPLCKSFHSWEDETPNFEHVDASQQEVPTGDSILDQNGPRDSQPSCAICMATGKPEKGGAHSCALCRTPVHAFGCSVPRGSGDEGFGGSDLLCIPCSKKADGNKSETHPIDTPEQEFQSVCYRVNPSTSNITGLQNTLKSEPISFAEGEIIDLTTDSPPLSPAISLHNHGGICSDDITIESPPPSPTHCDRSDLLGDHGQSHSPASNGSFTIVSDKICFGCNKKAVMRTSRTPKNNNRRFFTCSDPSTSKCRWMNWVDKKTTSATVSPKLSKRMTDFFPGVNNPSTSNSDNMTAIANNAPDHHSLTGEALSLAVEDIDTTPVAKISGLKRSLFNVGPKPVAKKPCVNSDKKYSSLELTDDTIDAAIEILRVDFPDVGGLQKPSEVAASFTFFDIAKTDKDTVQIIHDPRRDHWVLVIIPKFSQGPRVVYVYDSRQHTDAKLLISSYLECCIAQMCQENGPIISVVLPACQQQDLPMCGIFALAFAVDYCIVRKIRCPVFEVKNMERHMKDCLKEKHFRAFPKKPVGVTTPGRHSRKVALQVYCVCRMPEHYGPLMTECDFCHEHYHHDCQFKNST